MADARSALNAFGQSKPSFEMEEDDSFFAPPSPPKSPARAGLDLEEEDAFAITNRSSPFKRKRDGSLSPSRPHSSPVLRDVDSNRPPALDLEPDEAFGTASTSNYTALPSLQPRHFSVANLDLGNGYVPNKPLTGNSFSGKMLRFTRKQGAKVIGELASSDDNSPEALHKLANSLLKRPIHKMLETVESMEEAKLKAQEEQLLQAALEASKSEQKAKSKSKPIKEELWTDRYKPKQFTQLLGDERTHRSAMSWLKEWDQCVFKSSMTVNKLNALKRKREAAAQKAAFAGKEAFSNVQDPYGRPNEKILLLSGPPGMGKTTLAHVLAHQAGYQVLEINASDDRTAKVVTDKIQNALESRAITTKGSFSSSKPTCLIIDEIDGAGGGGEASFVRSLIKLVQEGSVFHKKKGKGKKEARPLLRPIICICNDLYAPVLRPLRTIARIIRFHAPTNVMLVKRLRTVCETEKLQSDTKSLNLLVETAEGDMRSCLNTLQFIKRKGDAVDEQAIRTTLVGIKDTGTSPTAVWDKLFKIKVNRKGKSQEDSDKYVDRLVNDVQTCGEYDRLAQGCFENYLTVKEPATGWKAIHAALEWISLYDRLDGKLKVDRNYELMPYIPYTFIPWHPLYANVANKTFEWPKVEYENYLKMTAHREIADAFSKTLPQEISCLYNSTSIVTELLSFLNRIISPDLKPVNSQLIKSDERAILAKLVVLMLRLHLSYLPDKSEDGQLSYKLEPAVDVFVHWEGKRAKDMAPSRYAVRQMIASEMEAHSLRKAGEDGPKITAKSIIDAYKTNKADLAVPKKDGPALDFFGRAVVPKTSTSDQDPKAVTVTLPTTKKRKIVYKYHEGFSNAVKLNIKVADLFRIAP